MTDELIPAYRCTGCQKIQIAKPPNMAYHQRFTGEGRRPPEMKMGGRQGRAGKWVKCGPWTEVILREVGTPKHA